MKEEEKTTTEESEDQDTTNDNYDPVDSNQSKIPTKSQEMQPWNTGNGRECGQKFWKN